MPKLPVKYFKTVTEYVKYNWSGAIDKLYPVVKTVTKDFTRTDPVHVRIGEDGEPEIHYTMTQANVNSWFANMDLGNATISVYAPNVTNASKLFVNVTAKSITLAMGQSVGMERTFSDCKAQKIALKGDFTFIGNAVNTFYNNKKLTDLTIEKNYTLRPNSDGLFYGCTALKEVPAFDLSPVTGSLWGLTSLTSCTAFHATGAVISMNLSKTQMKHDAILEVFNNLGTVSKDDNITLTLGSEKIALMSDEELAIATEKGWYLA